VRSTVVEPFWTLPVRTTTRVGDLHDLLAGTAGERIAMRWFADYPGRVPAGAYPVGWVPARREL
jgi:hypothetical protein